jgi:hypothetical protein
MMEQAISKLSTKLLRSQWHSITKFSPAGTVGIDLRWAGPQTTNSSFRAVPFSWRDLSGTCFATNQIIIQPFRAVAEKRL